MITATLAGSAARWNTLRCGPVCGVRRAAVRENTASRSAKGTHARMVASRRQHHLLGLIPRCAAGCASRLPPPECLPELHLPLAQKHPHWPCRPEMEPCLKLMVSFAVFEDVPVLAPERWGTRCYMANKWTIQNITLPPSLWPSVTSRRVMRPLMHCRVESSKLKQLPASSKPASSREQIALMILPASCTPGRAWHLPSRHLPSRLPT